MGGGSELGLICQTISTSSCSWNCSHNHPLNDLRWSLGFTNIPFWLTGHSCKKSPTSNKETPPNVDKFCIIAFNATSKCLKVSLPIIHISSIIKTFKYWYLFLNLWRVSSLGFLYLKDFNPGLTARGNAEHNVIPLIPVAAFPVDAEARTDGWSRF